MVFPSEPFRDVIESIGTDQMFSSFGVGCFNKRGVRSRGPFDEGGRLRSVCNVIASLRDAFAANPVQMLSKTRSLAPLRPVRLLSMRVGSKAIVTTI